MPSVSSVSKGRGVVGRELGITQHVVWLCEFVGAPRRAMTPIDAASESVRCCANYAAWLPAAMLSLPCVTWMKENQAAMPQRHSAIIAHAGSRPGLELEVHELSRARARGAIWRESVIELKTVRGHVAADCADQ